MKVPFVDLSRAYSAYKNEIMDAIASVVDRSAFVLGPDCESFEKSFAAFLGGTPVAGVNSGLDALKIALEAIGVGEGDEVITAANTFIATALAISATGATPVLVDCEDSTSNIDVKLIRAKINRNTKAIIPVHLYGHMANMDAILELAEEYGLKVIEDSAQAHGATFDGKMAGTFGDVGCFSFYPSKNLGSFGEGGAVATRSSIVMDKVKSLRNVGQKEKYHHEMLGHNSRLHALQAAILDVKLRHLSAENDSRRKAAELYRDYLGDLTELTLPVEQPGFKHVYHLYVVRLKEREALKNHLQQKGVQTGIHYPIPIHLQKCYTSLGYSEGSFQVTERQAKTILSLPIFPGITEDEIVTVARHTKDFFAKPQRRTG